MPFLKILKAISFQVEPLTLSNALNSYMNAFKTMLQSLEKKVRPRVSYVGFKQTPRKYRLHVVAEWAECDLLPIFR